MGTEWNEIKKAATRAQGKPDFNDDEALGYLWFLHVFSGIKHGVGGACRPQDKAS
jgi:hypothetical protein